MLIPETEASACHLCQNMCPCAEYWLDLSLHLITWDEWVSLLFTTFAWLLALHCEVECVIRSMPRKQQSTEVNRGKHFWRQRRKRKPRNQSWSSRDQIKMLPNKSLIKLEAPMTSALSSSANFAFARFYLHPHWRKKGQNTIQLFLHWSKKKANCTLVLKTDFLSLNHKTSRLLTFLCTWRKINHFIHGSDAVFLRERDKAVTKEIR